MCLFSERRRIILNNIKGFKILPYARKKDRHHQKIRLFSSKPFYVHSFWEEEHLSKHSFKFKSRKDLGNVKQIMFTLFTEFPTE